LLKRSVETSILRLSCLILLLYLIFGLILIQNKAQVLLDFIAWTSLLKVLIHLFSKSFSQAQFFHFFIRITLISSISFLALWDPAVNLSVNRSLLNTTLSSAFEDYCYIGLFLVPVIVANRLNCSFPISLSRISTASILVAIALSLFCALASERRLYLGALLFLVIIVILRQLFSLLSSRLIFSKTTLLTLVFVLFAGPFIVHKFLPRFQSYESAGSILFNERVVESVHMVADLQSDLFTRTLGSGLGGTYNTLPQLLLAREMDQSRNSTNGLFFAVPDRTRHVHIFMFLIYLRFGIVAYSIVLLLLLNKSFWLLGLPQFYLAYLSPFLFSLFTGLTLTSGSTAVVLVLPLALIPLRNHAYNSRQHFINNPS
jgi:hypothetical protein